MNTVTEAIIIAITIGITIKDLDLVVNPFDGLVTQSGVVTDVVNGLYILVT